MKLRPLSPSTLKEFVTCPLSFHAVRIEKSVTQTYNVKASRGTEVHEIFEKRMLYGTPLPPELGIHEAYLKRLEDFPGVAYCEQEVGINSMGEACGFWEADFARFKIDYTKMDIHSESARVIDYKTGKEKYVDDRQLAFAAIYTFLKYPEVQLVNSQYYFTATQLPRKKVWARKEMDGLVEAMAPDILQWKEAFKTDTWQPRPNALCNGWCAKTDCDHWKPKRERNW